jgi:hypothetical protein
VRLPDAWRAFLASRSNTDAKLDQMAVIRT